MILKFISNFTVDSAVLNTAPQIKSLIMYLRMLCFGFQSNLPAFYIL